MTQITTVPPGPLVTASGYDAKGTRRFQVRVLAGKFFCSSCTLEGIEMVSTKSVAILFISSGLHSVILEYILIYSSYRRHGKLFPFIVALEIIRNLRI